VIRILRTGAAVLAGVALGAGALAAVAGGAVPAGGRSFSFLTEPTDQLGVPGYVAGTELTPEGSLYTGWAELAFRFGPRLQPANGTVRDLFGDRFPVVRYYMRAGAVDYTVTVFSAAVGQRPVNFIRVVIRNGSGRPATAAWAAGLLYSGGATLATGQPAFRFTRPARPQREGLYTQPGAAFDPASRWAFERDSVTRDGQVLVIFPPAPPGFARRLAIRPGAGGPVTEQTVFGQVGDRGRLPADGRAELDFKMPVVPTRPGGGDYRAIAGAGFGGELARVLRYWRRLFGGAIQIQLPEPKVQDTFYTSLANMALPRYPAARGGWVQAVNKLQYNAFWLRDGAIIAGAFDLAGLHRLAAQDLAFFPSWQQPDGLFISRPQQYDGFGEALWAIGQHALRTRDRAFAVEMLAPVQRAMTWFERERTSDPWGLMPASAPGDDELTSGHMTGDDFWAADGIREAIVMASLIGRRDLADRWTVDLGSFMSDLRARLAQAEATTGGWIPPALEANGGQDWGNLGAAYPEPVLQPGDPAVTATLRHARSQFREGIATYYSGTVLHDYLAFRVFETELLRGQQRAVVDGLYSELAHTTSTNAGFELGVRRHGSRVLDADLAPHGTFAAEYVALLRNMLVRENGSQIVLMSALSPRWLLPGRRLAVGHADTTRGTISYALQSLRGGAILSWSARVMPGTKLVWPVPAAARDVRATGLSRDGRTIALGGGRAGRLRVQWRLVGPFPSFEATARRVLSQYPG
jgi:hypothetical protein